MIPIHELLSRIRWDPAFGHARFAIGYWDRVQRRVLRVDLADIRMQAGDHRTFEVMDVEGQSHLVPYHRIREVYRNGELIWWRHPASGPFLLRCRGRKGSVRATEHGARDPFAHGFSNAPSVRMPASP